MNKAFIVYLFRLAQNKPMQFHQTTTAHKMKSIGTVTEPYLYKLDTSSLYSLLLASVERARLLNDRQIYVKRVN